jgi:glycosyltransferase involved in cell wall biosynthesis
MAPEKVAIVGYEADGLRDFVRCDAEVLGQLGAEVRFVGHRPLEIRKACKWASRVVVWFLGEHAFYATWFARRRRIPVLIILGGQERVADREIGYGLWLRPWHVRARCRWALRHATYVWAVEPTLATSALRIARVPRDVRIVPTIFDAGLFRPEKKDGSVAFACSIGDEGYAVRKGLPTLLDAARLLPGQRFRVVGRGPWPHHPENVEFLGYRSRTDYSEALGRATVIVNASKHEGLSNVVCEAMLAGCVPVLSDIPGNRHAAGTFDGAHFFPFGNPKALAAAIDDARRSASPEVTAAARGYVLERFPPSLRTTAFREFLGGGLDWQV